MWLGEPCNVHYLNIQVRQELSNSLQCVLPFILQILGLQTNTDVGLQALKCLQVCLIQCSTIVNHCSNVK